MRTASGVCLTPMMSGMLLPEQLPEAGYLPIRLLPMVRWKTRLTSCTLVTQQWKRPKRVVSLKLRQSRRVDWLEIRSWDSH